MLLCQNGGRNEVDDLFALLYCLERCTDCNLGFAVSDIAADQAVHDLLLSMSAFVASIAAS